jgi:hypothetical protein
VSDCDGGLLGAFCRYTFPVERQKKFDMMLHIDVVGNPHWWNLVAWCEEYHAKRSAGIIDEDLPLRSDKVYSTIQAAHSIVVATIGLKWKVCLEALNRLRAVLVVYDKRWLD